MAYSANTAKAQKQLNALGFKGANGRSLVVDGLWGKNTSYAVLNFQKQHGEVSNTGRLDSNTIKVLNYYYSKKVVPTSSKSVSTTLSQVSKPSPVSFQTGSKFDISKLLQNKALMYVAVGITLIAITYPVIINKRRA